MPVFGLEGNWQEDDDEECDDSHVSRYGVEDLALWAQSEDEEKLDSSPADGLDALLRRVQGAEAAIVGRKVEEWRQHVTSWLNGLQKELKAACNEAAERAKADDESIADVFSGFSKERHADGHHDAPHDLQEGSAETETRRRARQALEEENMLFEAEMNRQREREKEQEEHRRREEQEAALQEQQHQHQQVEGKGREQKEEENQNHGDGMPTTTGQIQQDQAQGTWNSYDEAGEHVSQGAKEAEESARVMLEEVSEQARTIQDRRQRRELKRAAQHVVQISATKRQVNLKAKAITECLSSLSGNERACALSFAVASVANQCEDQVATQPHFAFPLASCCQIVSQSVPEFAILLSGELQSRSSIVVPKSFTGRYSSKYLGFREGESEDEFVKRSGAYVRLIGALVHYGGMNRNFGWAWLARLLNAVPVSRLAASALLAFLEAAGYAMGRAHGKNFAGLLECINREYLPKLMERGKDAQPTRMQLTWYIREKRHLKEPAGSVMPERDEGSLAIQNL